MQKIEGSLFTHFQKNVSSHEGELFKGSFKTVYRKEWSKFGGTVNKVRASPGYIIETFRDLISEVALVTINNRNFEMFYRGQTSDHLNNKGAIYKDRIQKSTIFPTICRPDIKDDGSPKYSVRRTTIDERYKKLYSFIDFINKKERNRYRDEYLMALFQHYEILPTPLIDITQSLRVAATFALKKSEIGYIYVLGLPFPNQSVSYFIDSGIILLKLQNIMNVDALRPRYQEGYLIGKFPFSNHKTQFDDLSNRMGAKFYIDNTNGKFWDEDFLPMPNEVLYPKNDPTEKYLLEVNKDFSDNYSLIK